MDTGQCARTPYEQMPAAEASVNAQVIYENGLCHLKTAAAMARNARVTKYLFWNVKEKYKFIALSLENFRYYFCLQHAASLTE